MNLIKSAVTVALVAGVSLAGAQSANAAFITGSISFNDGFDPAGIPAVPSTSIVSGLTSFDLNNLVNVYTPGSATGDFVGTTSATANDVAPPPLPTVMYTTDSGFTITVTSLLATNVTALTCNAGGLCSDSIQLALGGTVTKAGFDPTVWLGVWTANGTCLQGVGTTCGSNVTASWSSSVTATGRDVVPEPATMVLLGMGLLGAGLARRRR